MSKTINNLSNDIEIVHGTNEKETIPKLGLRTIIQDNWVILVSAVGSSGITSVVHKVKFLYTDVTTPSAASAEALRDIILEYKNDLPTIDVGQDVAKVSVRNSAYAHYTDVYHIDEEDLGIAETGDADGDTNTIEDDSAAFSNATVAVGYTAYQTTDSESATVNSVTDADTVETTTLTGAATWASKAYLLPEVKRFEISMESFKFMSIHYKLAANDGNNSCYLKLYATNNADADATDDTDWHDVTLDILGFVRVEADGITATTAVTTEDIKFMDEDVIALKFMIKIVAECEDATPDNDIDVYVKKGY